MNVFISRLIATEQSFTSDSINKIIIIIAEVCFILCSKHLFVCQVSPTE